MPELSAKSAKALHDVAVEAANLSGSVFGTEVDSYAAAIEDVKDFQKAGFLGLQIMNPPESIEREELAAAKIISNEMSVGTATLKAPSRDVLALGRVALLATTKDEFDAQDIENVLLPGVEEVRAELANQIFSFAQNLERIQNRVLQILEEIDEIVAAGLGITPAEHRIIRKRCGEFPLSVTVERPRFVWSPDRKRQARRAYNPGSDLSNGAKKQIRESKPLAESRAVTQEVARGSG